MRLIGYYAVHSLFNQIRKMLKTWVLLFILCCGLIGGMAGYGAAVLSEYSEEQAAEEMAEEIAAEDTPEEEEVFSEKTGGEWPLPISAAAVFELAAGALILILSVYSAFMADQNGSKIFLPADVTLLFSSPMKPQSVLMFRLSMQMGMMLFLTVYMFIQIPNLVMNLGMSVGAAAAVIIAWGFLLIFERLIQMSLYVLGSTNGKVRRMIRPVTCAVLGTAAAAFLIFARVSGLPPLEAADRFFNAPATRWIPFWGWLKGFCVYAAEGKTAMVFLMAALLAAGSGILVYLIWQVKADFYEDAMAKSEETALLQREMRESGSLTVRRKKQKDRSQTLLRDGMKYGSGANVFFFRTLYNRFRFARFRFFTKTMAVYLAAGLGSACFFRLLSENGSAEMFTVSALILGGIVFFRSLGNPLDEDVRMAYFRMIPEPSFLKLFWSAAGGSANMMLDLLPALAGAALILGASVPAAAGWLLFLVTVDLYSTTVATFIDITVPVEAGATLKQIVQVMFVYFGLLPAAAIIFAGYMTDRLFMALVLAALVHLVIGLIFLALGANALEPGDHAAHPVRVLSPEEKAAAGKAFSWCGFSAFVILAAGSVLQLAVMDFVGNHFPGLLETSWGIWVFGFGPLHLAAFPLGLLLMRRVPAVPVPGGGMSRKETALALPVSFFLMYAGNIVGNILFLAARRLFGGSGNASPAADLVSRDSLFWKVLVIVIIAPVLEELVFRKNLIDRLHVYGQGLAVLTSALAFGLFHGNLVQSIYAFLMGLPLGYVYMKTGKIRITIGMHMIVNFMGSVLAPALLERVDMDAVSLLDPSEITGISQLAEMGVLPLLVYLVLIILAAVSGLVILILYLKRIDFDPEPKELSGKEGIRTAYVNAGMILLLLGTLAMTAFSFFGVG